MKFFLGAVALLFLMCFSVLMPGRAVADAVNLSLNVGTGYYTCKRFFFGVSHCAELPRCGPATIDDPASPIECHGIVATCDVWSTLQSRVVYEKFDLTLLVDGAVHTLPGWSRDAIVEATGLANFCVAQKKK